MEFVKHLMDIVLIFIGLAPIILQIGSAIAHKSHNQKIKNLLERATIIVNALEQTGGTGAQKKRTAVEKLSNYAAEVGIKVTPDQVDDYIEYAVKFMNAVNGGK